MMTSSQVRQSFLDFFKKHGHTIVPSSSLMPESPNLLFTNAGMNQFVPIFLGETKCPYKPGRAADTQKCIRAGGKHNDLDDVGFDTYHHTFFEMLGNWSFGDYFKKEAIEWGWELLTKEWKMPKERLYATVYKPGKGDPAEFDQEAYDIWAGIFKKEGMDAKVHIKYGGKKDNFWMMADTGPCGPCSEIHVDLTEKGDTKGNLVNLGSDRCIEIWNLVFIEFNATANGKFEPLPAKNVDTGLGFDRVVGIMATTKNFKDFSQSHSNYNGDQFFDIIQQTEKLSGKKYTRTVPTKREGLSPQEQTDVAFRVVADHVRCVSCAIADGILPSNEGRNYVIRRILRRAIMYSRKLDLKPGDLSKLSAKVVESLGGVFLELKAQQKTIAQVILGEEEMFGKTLQRGLQQFEKHASQKKITGENAFELYDTYGFPLDLTELLAQERGLAVDKSGFEAEMEKQRARARAAQKKTEVVVQGTGAAQTEFVGYDDKNLENFSAKVVAAEPGKYVITDKSPFYAEMGGQVGDSGILEYKGQKIAITDTKFDSNGQQFHLVKDILAIPAGAEVRLSVDFSRRKKIAKHHSATHLLDWALRQNLGGHVKQCGSLVSPDRLRFDFTHFAPVAHVELKRMESAINEKILQNAAVKTSVVPFSEKPADVVAAFGEKYGERVRVVDIGGYSKELCGGTHVGMTGEIGFFKIVGESAIAAGTRRIEAVVGESAVALIQAQTEELKAAALELNCAPEEVAEKLKQLKTRLFDLEAKLKSGRQKELHALKANLVSKAGAKNSLPEVKAVVEGCSPDDLKNLSQLILAEIKEGSVVLGSVFDGKANVLAAGSKEAVAKGFNAGDVIRTLTAEIGGKGGGRPEMAMGSGKAVERLQEAFKKV